MLGKRILALPINLYNTNNYEEIIAHILTKVKNIESKIDRDGENDICYV